MNRSRKLLLTAALCGLVSYSATESQATDIDVDATLTASAAVTVVKNSDIDFASVDFGGGHSGVIELGPDGNAALAGGAANLTLSGTPSAGELAITSGAGIIDFTCDATAIIDDGIAGPLTITTVVWDTSAAATFAGATNTCAGLGAGTVSIDTGVTANPTLYVGAELTIALNALTGSSGSTPFDTSTATGNPITFRMVFQ